MWRIFVLIGEAIVLSGAIVKTAEPTATCTLGKIGINRRCDSYNPYNTLRFRAALDDARPPIVLLLVPCHTPPEAPLTCGPVSTDVTVSRLLWARDAKPSE
jgi:hypothetical protein